MYILRETQTTAAIIVGTHTLRIAGPWSSLFRGKTLEGASVAITKEPTGLSLRRRGILETKKRLCGTTSSGDGQWILESRWKMKEIKVL